MLLDMIYLGSWMMNAHGSEDEEKSAPYEELEQKLLSFAKGFGCTDLVDFHKGFDKFFHSLKVEEGPVMEFIDQYNNNTFWDELSSRLAQRDYLEEHGREKLEGMDPIAVMSGEDELAEKYEEEFVRNGVANLRIVKTG
jgi:hypothetical protein